MSVCGGVSEWFLHTTPIHSSANGNKTFMSYTSNFAIKKLNKKKEKQQDLFGIVVVCVLWLPLLIFIANII